MFKSQVYKAVMAHVTEKIRVADAAYEEALSKHQETFEHDVERAEQVLLQSQGQALEEAVASVINSLK